MTAFSKKVLFFLLATRLYFPSVILGSEEAALPQWLPVKHVRLGDGNYSLISVATISAMHLGVQPQPLESLADVFSSHKAHNPKKRYLQIEVRLRDYVFAHSPQGEVVRSDSLVTNTRGFKRGVDDLSVDDLALEHKNRLKARLKATSGDNDGEQQGRLNNYTNPAVFLGNVTKNAEAFILRCLKTPISIQQLRVAFFDLYKNTQQHEYIPQTRDLFKRLMQEIAMQSLEKPLSRSSISSPLELLLEEFHDGTIYSTSNSILFMNFQVHRMLVDAFKDEELKVKAIPIFLELIDYFIDEDEDDEKVTDPDRKALLGRIKWFKKNQNGNDGDLERKAMSDDDDPVAELAQVESLFSPTTPFDIYTESKKLYKELMKLQEGAAKFDDISEKARNYRLDSYIAGYNKAFLGFEFDNNNEQFSAYYFAAIVQQMPQGYWKIGKMIEGGDSIPEAFLANVKKIKLLKQEEDLKVEEEDLDAEQKGVPVQNIDCTQPEFWFEMALAQDDPANNFPISEGFLIDEAFELAQLYTDQGKLEDAARIYQKIQKRGYIDAFIRESEMWKDAGDYQRSEGVYKVKQGGDLRWNEALNWFVQEYEIGLPTINKQKRTQCLKYRYDNITRYFSNLLDVVGAE